MKIAIFGMHEDTQTGFDHAEWDEVWGLAHDLETPLRCTAAFEAHSEQIVDRHCPEHRERLESLALGMPLYTAWSWSANLGPLHVCKPYGSLEHGHRIESSIAYMMACAMEQASEIGIFGVDMSAGDEYAYQRPNMAYLIGLAEGLGIKVSLHPSSALFASSWTGGCYGHQLNVDDMEYRLGRQARVEEVVQDEAVA